MFRRLAWLAKLVAAGLIISFLSIWTTGYIVTSYVDSLLKQFQLPLEVPPMTMTGVWGKLWGADPLLTSDLAGSGSASSDTAGDRLSSGEQIEDAVDAFHPMPDAPLTDIGMGKGSQAAGNAELGDDAGIWEGSSDAEEAGAENGQSSTGGLEAQGSIADLDGTEVAITTDAITATKDRMSDEDKGELFGLLMSKLPQQSWQEISEYVENGLTEQELTSVQQIMAMHLDKADYEKMMGILKKY